MSSPAAAASMTSARRGPAGDSTSAAVTDIWIGDRSRITMWRRSAASGMWSRRCVPIVTDFPSTGCSKRPSRSNRAVPSSGVAGTTAVSAPGSMTMPVVSSVRRSAEKLGMGVSMSATGSRIVRSMPSTPMTLRAATTAAVHLDEASTKVCIGRRRKAADA